MSRPSLWNSKARKMNDPCGYVVPENVKMLGHLIDYTMSIVSNRRHVLDNDLSRPHDLGETCHAVVERPGNFSRDDGPKAASGRATFSSNRPGKFAPG